MRSVTEWLGEYGGSHQNPVNKLLHWICVPPIVLAVMGLLWSAPVPAVFADVSPWLNWATLAAAAALAYYLVLSPALAVGVLIAFIVLLLITQLSQVKTVLPCFSLTFPASICNSVVSLIFRS